MASALLGALGISTQFCWLKAGFLLPWLSFPPRMALCLRLGGGNSEQRIGNPQPSHPARSRQGGADGNSVQWASIMGLQRARSGRKFFTLLCKEPVTERQEEERPPSRHHQYCHHHHHHHHYRHLLHHCYGLRYVLPKNVGVLFFWK